MSVCARSCSWMIVLAICAPQIGCDDPEATSNAAEQAATEEAPPVNELAGARVVATVNGKNIYERDVRYWLQHNTQGRQTDPTPEQHRNMLEAIISQELILQRATELGLDRNRQYQEGLMAKQAELDSLRRTAIRDLFYLHQTRQIPSPTDEEVRRFYDENAALIGTTYHVQHILKRSRDEIGDVRERLEAGADFEEVAEEPFASLPPSASRPWDMRSITWQQVPEPWRATLATLEVGAVSDVISGENDRHWIVRLVSKEEDPSITFETTREDLRRILERDALENLRSGLDDALRAEAEIDYVAQ